MVKPGTNQVAWMPHDFSKARMRRDASAPNSPRESGVGVVIPRAMKPDWVSKSKVKQTMWRGMASPPGSEVFVDTAAGVDAPRAVHRAFEVSLSMKLPL